MWPNWIELHRDLGIETALRLPCDGDRTTCTLQVGRFGEVAIVPQGATAAAGFSLQGFRGPRLVRIEHGPLMADEALARAAAMVREIGGAAAIAAAA